MEQPQGINLDPSVLISVQNERLASAAIREAQELITQTRAASQSAGQRLAQAQATLTGMTASYATYINCYCVRHSLSLSFIHL